MSSIRMMIVGLATMALAVPAMAESPQGGSRSSSAWGDLPLPAKVMKQLDTNKDGFLSEEEFLASPLCKNREVGKELFKRIDTNHDGKISLAELKTAYSKMRATNSARGQESAQVYTAADDTDSPRVRNRQGGGRGPMPGGPGMQGGGGGFGSGQVGGFGAFGPGQGGGAFGFANGRSPQGGQFFQSRAQGNGPRGVAAGGRAVSHGKQAKAKTKSKAGKKSSKAVKARQDLQAWEGRQAWQGQVCEGQERSGWNAPDSSCWL